MQALRADASSSINDQVAQMPPIISMRSRKCKLLEAFTAPEGDRLTASTVQGKACISAHTFLPGDTSSCKNTHGNAATVLSTLYHQCIAHHTASPGIWQQMHYLSSVLYELDQEVVTGGPLMTTVQAVGVPIHRHSPSLQQIPGNHIGINQKQQLRMSTYLHGNAWLADSFATTAA